MQSLNREEIQYRGGDGSRPRHNLERDGRPPLLRHYTTTPNIIPIIKYCYL